MKTKSYSSVDGFIHSRNDGLSPKKTNSQPILNRTRNTNPITTTPVTTNSQGINSVRQDIQAALGSLDVYDDPIPKSRRERRRQKQLKNSNRKFKKRFVVLPILAIIIITLGIVGYLFVKANLITSKIFNGGNLLSLIEPGTPLKTDAQGRTNILLFGTSQDDSAHQNASGGGGLWLTDSIELASIDQKHNTVKLVGIPRDLWVALQNCDVGNYAKINAVYECGANLFNSNGVPGPNYSTQDAAGASQLMSTIQQVTGITPQYYVHADYTVLKQAVDAVGGIDVSIAGDGASGVYDTNFDWDCPKGPYTCKNVYYPKDGIYHLDGTQALFLSRARGDYGTYSYKDFGLARGDFDRQANQQKVLIALESKVKTASVLANPIALNSLLDAFGNNISTDLQGGEMKTLLTFAKGLPSTSITQVSLVKDGSQVVTTGDISGQSVVMPTSGVYDFSSIINYLNTQLSTNPATAEGATIAVYNASAVAGAAAKEQTALTKQGFAVDTIGTAASADAGTGTYTLYDQSLGKKPQTLAALQTALGVKVTAGALPTDITTTDDFVVIVN